MGDMLKNGMTWLESQRTAHLAGPAEYRRAGQEALTVIATVGQTTYEVDDEYGLRVEAHVTDFLILADELWPVVDEPQTGDQIVVEGRLYEVMELSGQGHWRWSDPYQTTLRIHTKELGTDT